MAVSGIITASDFSNFEPKLIAAAKFTLQNKVLMPQLFRQEALLPSMGRTWNQPRHGTVTATALTEGVPLAIGQVPTQTNTAITPGEAGCEVVLTDVALSSGRDDYARQMGRVMADALAKKIDVDGLTRFTDFTTIGTVAVSGTPASSITVGHVNAGVSRIRAASQPPPTPHWFVTRPETMRVVLNAAGPTGTYPIPSGLSQELIEMYYMHDFRLFSLNGGFATANLPTNLVAAASPCAVGAVFSQESEVFVSAHDTEFEKDRDIELRGWVMTAVARYGYGADVTAWGCGLTMDSTLAIS